jgi:hypothetical protein
MNFFGVPILIMIILVKFFSNSTGNMHTELFLVNIFTLVILVEFHLVESRLNKTIFDDMCFPFI